MADNAETQGTVAAAVPPEPNLENLRDAAAECTACPLYRDATQTVFGEGPERARIMFVGEQPGDSEDLAGHPFVGPAGRLLDRCMIEAGLNLSTGSRLASECRASCSMALVKVF